MTAGKFSAPYVLATYLCRGASTSTTSRPRRWPTRRFSPWPHASNSREDDGYEAAFPESWGASVVVELRDGTTLTGARDYPGETTATPFPTRSIALGTVRSWRTGSAGQEHNARVDEALDALDAVAERPVRSTVDTLRP